MAEQKDFIMHDMSTTLSREVHILEPHQKWSEEGRPDLDWYRETLEINFHLFQFYQDHDLVKKKPIVTDLESARSVILRYSDFTERGQRFIMSQATEKWKGTIYRRKNPKPGDFNIKYLQRKLDALE